MDIFQKIAKIPWVKEKERDGKVGIDSFYLLGHNHRYFLKMGANVRVDNTYFRSGTYYFNQKELEQAKKFLRDKKLNLGNFSLKMTTKFLTLAKNYEKFITKYSGYNFSNLSNKHIAKIFQALIEYNADLVPYSFIISLILEKIAEEQICEYLIRYYKDPQSVYQTLITNPRQNESSLEYFSKINLALEYKVSGNSKKFNTNIDRHLQKFAWLSVYHPGEQPKTQVELVKEIKEFASLNTAKELRLKKLVRTNHKTKTIIKLPKHLRLLVSVMRQNVWVRTYRRELMSLGFYKFMPLFKVVASRMEVPISNIEHIACWEIIDFLKTGKKIPQKILRERSKFFVGISMGGKPIILSGLSAQKLTTPKMTFQKQALKGQSVFPGLAQGKVRIVKTKTDLAKVSPGEILVVHTLGVWMNQVLPKVSAIITEAGGVLQHAAVMAREFKKPSIVGTKVALQILKNGDIVKVDANKGLIIIQ